MEDDGSAVDSGDVAIGRPRGVRALAVAGTFLLPGLGHCLTGNWKRGVFWFVVSLAMTLLTVVILANPSLVRILVVLVPTLGLLGLGMIVDAFVKAARSGRRGVAWGVLRYLVACVLLVVAAGRIPGKLVNRYVIEPYVKSYNVHGSSMNPTLIDGDMFLSHSIEGGRLDRWSIVTMEHPETGASTMVVRVVGLPGEKVEIVDEALMVNDKKVTLPDDVGPYRVMSYTKYESEELAGRPGAGCEGNAITLGDDEYYVLGDNSELSFDSRLWPRPVPGHQLGAVTRSCITGEVTVRYWPPSRWEMLR